MNELFSQGGKGSTGILTNKQAIARKFGVKQNEVVYFSVGVDLGGYKVIYDKSTQRAYSLPVFSVGTTAVSLNEHAILVHSTGTVDLGELAATRREFVSLSDSFATGLVVNTRNELLFHNGIGYTYLGSLPVTITAGTNPVGNADWKPQTDPDLRAELAAADGALSVGGAILECQTVAQAQAISGLTEGRKVRTYYYNTPVVTDWVFTSSAPSDGVFYIPAVGGYLTLMTPNFASAGIIEGEYVPLNAAHNRNVIQKLVRDTRFSKFEYGATGTFYVLGSIHPLRDNIEIHHEAGVTVMGRYDDPTVGPEIMGLNSGGMWSFAHFLNPDATVWDDNNYTITAVMKNVTYILNGKIGTEYNSIHSNPHNNNAIGFFTCENCSVVGSGGVIGSDHRGINVDGGGR